MGEYNEWDPKPQHWAVKNDFGVWELFVPDLEDGSQGIKHRWIYTLGHCCIP